MSMRTYVGARYVPRFMGTYDATQGYEGLDVVDNGMGTSYIARKNVAPGTPLTDTTSWALYGAASGAIINLQNQIDAIDTRVIALEPLKGGFVTPEAYGAVGDGVTDDQAAIQDAIDANNNIIFKGNYYIGSELVVPANRNLIGYGSTIKTDQSIKIFRNEHWNHNTIVDENINIEGFYIDCTDNTTYDQKNNCIYMRGVDNLSVRNVYILNSGSDGIYIGRGLGSGVTKYNRNVLIENVIVDGYRRQGISVVCGDVKIDNCNIINTHNVVGYAVDVEPNEALDNSNVEITHSFLDGGVNNSSDDGLSTNILRVKDSVITKAGGSAVVGLRETVQVENCDITSTGAFKAVTMATANNNIVANCHIKSDDVGIYISNAPHALIDDNFIEAEDHAINLVACLYATIRGNAIISNINAHSIYVRSTSHWLKIIDNTVGEPASASTKYGIYVSDAMYGMIEGNEFAGSARFDREITTSSTDYTLVTNNIVHTGKIVVNDTNKVVANNLEI